MISTPVQAKRGTSRSCRSYKCLVKGALVELKCVKNVFLDNLNAGGWQGRVFGAFIISRI